MIREEKGQSLVEFALVIPILLIVLVGIFDIGRMLYSYSALHFTAQETVRVGSFGSEDSELEQFARNNFQAGDSTLLNVEITPTEEERKSGEYVTVILEYPIEPFIPFVNKLFSEPILLKSDSTIRIE
ncbi:TadE/TadG family type IV pilus assembly protein [Evansella sp. AB-P1]|uniref:TadE/TadG family type IV pilus assembly protein n=1 Tax=Evansella sp. AB-P1 TaxID=3037653 RepID=UPI00241D59C3|nr:TadE/TadG family type IV pilus assembly protein [Evansella sp. AB-P1]MDG5790058.1 TadE/TadG family type IV pilus assembly protein [Evansella sp. AB-P1]